MTKVEIAAEAVEGCGHAAYWLMEELVPVLGFDHPLLAMVEHLEAECWRVAVLLALELKD